MCPLHTGARLDLVEVLLRLVDEHGRLVLPGQFLSATERYRLMPSIDRRVIELTLRQIGQQPDQRRERRRYAINLSGQTLGTPDFLDFVLAEVDASGVSPLRLCFEITETTAITSFTSASRFMAALRERGCLFILDDFGSGFSSFNKLRSLPVELLKIDGSLVRGVDSDPVKREMVTAVHRIARSMATATIAECVETEEEYTTVRAIGVDYAQGFWAAPPEPLRRPGSTTS
jgi:EAL domain-containing protein (putative c-di-GMP-specific phosphodiesterase class I)